MACFIAPTTAAIITTSLRKKIPAKYHMEWLIMLLWGGTIMLIVDHIISGELVAYPPFLTANPSKMIPEILTTGVIMTVSVICIWLVMLFINKKVKVQKISTYLSSIK
jgi:hypothetical protein